MIEPFLQYWIPQVFWLGVLWLLLYTFLHFVVVPRLIRLRKRRDHALKIRQMSAERLEKNIARMERVLQRRQMDSAMKVRQLVDHARRESAQALRDVVQEEMSALRVANYKEEGTFKKESDALRERIKQNVPKAAEQFVDTLIQEEPHV